MFVQPTSSCRVWVLLWARDGNGGVELCSRDAAVRCCCCLAEGFSPQFPVSLGGFLF